MYRHGDHLLRNHNHACIIYSAYGWFHFMHAWSHIHASASYIVLHTTKLGPRSFSYIENVTYIPSTNMSLSSARIAHA